MSTEDQAVAELENMGRKLATKHNGDSCPRRKWLSYAEIVDREPRIKRAEALAREYSGSRDYHLWYRRVKPAFIGLVGIMSRHPDERLHSSWAYDVVYRHLLSIYEGDAGPQAA